MRPLSQPPKESAASVRMSQAMPPDFVHLLQHMQYAHIMLSRLFILMSFSGQELAVVCLVQK